MLQEQTVANHATQA